SGFLPALAVSSRDLPGPAYLSPDPPPPLRGEPSGRVTEQPVNGSGCRAAVVKAAESRGERVVGSPVTAVGILQASQGVDHVVTGAKQRAGCLGLEIEVETPEPVAVALEVVGKEKHRPA